MILADAGNEYHRAITRQGPAISMTSWTRTTEHSYRYRMSSHGDPQHQFNDEFDDTPRDGYRPSGVSGPIESIRATLERCICGTTDARFVLGRYAHRLSRIADRVAEVREEGDSPELLHAQQCLEHAAQTILGALPALDDAGQASGNYANRL